MFKARLRKRSKGFTLLELVVVIAIIAVLVLIASPKFTGKTKEATLTKHLANVKVLENTMDRYVLDKGDFPRLTDDAYTDEEIVAFSDKIFDITGKEVTLDPAGNYYDIDYLALKDYVKVPSNKDKANYVLQNPVGKVFYLEGLNQAGKDRADFTTSKPEVDVPGDKEPEPSYDEYIATDGDFQWVVDINGYEANGLRGYYKYIGSEKIVKIPHKIEGSELTSYYKMFNGTDVSKVISDNSNVTNMSYMFYQSRATSLDLSSFDTSSVTNMYCMFHSSQATSLDLSSFDTSNVANMGYMFYASRAISLDLSSFDTSSVTNMTWMFYASQVKTGYARTNVDMGNFNASSDKPSSLVFALKSNKDYTWLNDNSGYEINGVKGYYKYIGESKTVKIPHKIEGNLLTSYYKMFTGTDVSKVISDNSNVTNMSYMFAESKATSLDLSSFDTSNVTNMSYMFYASRAISLDLSSFDTSNVTNMQSMFNSSQATSLDLSSFDTSNVANMGHMFVESKATSLDLSSFDTSKVTNMNWMFFVSQVKTGYARTNVDAGRFNASYDKPAGLVFTVK